MSELVYHMVLGWEVRCRDKVWTPVASLVGNGGLFTASVLTLALTITTSHQKKLQESRNN